MHSIEVIKSACLAALPDPDDEDADDGPDLGLYRAVCDPATVLEMADIIDQLIGFTEAQGGPEGYALLVQVKQALPRE